MNIHNENGKTRQGYMEYWCERKRKIKNDELGKNKGNGNVEIRAEVIVFNIRRMMILISLWCGRNWILAIKMQSLFKLFLFVNRD